MQDIKELLLQRSSKGITGVVFAVVAAVISIAMAIWVITLIFGAINQGSWSASANTTFIQVQNNAWSAITILTITIIIMAVGSIFAFLGMGKKQ